MANEISSTSVTETTKANDLNVFEYVMTCLNELSNQSRRSNNCYHGNLLSAR
ncbi:transposase (fragment) [Alteromonas alvinellae]